MTKDALSALLQSRLTKKMKTDLAARLAAGEGIAALLLDMTFEEHSAPAFRAAWLLETIFFGSPAAFEPILKYFLDKYPEQQNNSCRRHFTKIMISLTAGENLKQIGKEQVERVIEATFGWLSDASVPVAVKANCMDILYNLKGCDDWIKDELEAQILFLLKDGTAALQSRGRKFMNKK